ncbi:hypothetical protein SAMN05216386_1692 [Nitrosospira briensis]|uniref:Uncharacterized protein n=1 Tax=Nitrosospira briensis TaxID=35799 RepID=A0A1I5BJD2_9PROT|nr:hypothetical protein [Nitrosospira briensis]SFN74699.1 hypothetical protein SAMN05216386_1692 [Nitrosospira briensis]
MIRAVWLLPVIFVLACERDVPQVDDPNKIVVKGEEMSQTDSSHFLQQSPEIALEVNP